MGQYNQKEENEYADCQQQYQQQYNNDISPIVFDSISDFSETSSAFQPYIPEQRQGILQLQVNKLSPDNIRLPSFNFKHI